jgi:hypothetical protein
MAEVFQMNADLVGAACFGLALNECFAIARIEDAVVSERLASTLDNRHFLPVDGMATDGGIDFAVGHAGDSIDEGEVGFFHIPRGELIGERAVDLLGFGNDEAARSFLVEAVDDTRALGAAHDFDARAVVQKSVSEGSFAVACAGMDDETSGLVEDEEEFVLEENPQRHFLGGERRGCGFLWDFQNHRVSFAQNERGFGRIAIHERTAVADETLQAGTGKIGAERTKESVEALAGMGVVDQGFHAIGRRIGHDSDASAFSPSP